MLAGWQADFQDLGHTGQTAILRCWDARLAQSAWRTETLLYFIRAASLDPGPANCYRSGPDCVLIATAQFTVHGSMKRRPFLLLCASSLLAGCSSWNLFSLSEPKTPDDTADDQPHAVGDLAVPFGMFPVKVEAVGLVAGLHGTGSDPEPSPQRAMLMAEMQRRGVENPNQLLATRNYSLVIVRGFLRPGMQKGDHFDVELRVKDRSETTSLRGGYLLETRLSDMAMIYGKLLDGKVRGVAQGPVLVDPSATEKHNSVQLGRGVVLGGGVARESRAVGLFLNGVEETNMTPRTTPQCGREERQVANAINRRFSTHKHGIKEGVARAIRGNYVELAVDPAYKDNLVRYFQVLRAIELRETSAEVSLRLTKLKTKLLDPVTAAEAAIKLEAIGKPAVDVLIAGTQSPRPESAILCRRGAGLSRSPRGGRAVGQGGP